jgi:putative acetyltransferase
VILPKEVQPDSLVHLHFSPEMQVSKVSQNAVSVRQETPDDLQAIRRVNTDAFGRPAEANLVDVLRRHWQVIFSLVAEVEREVVGHVLLTQVTLMPTVPGLRMLGLGPIAVLPQSQGQGIGSMLMREAIGQACADGWQVMVALGNPEYYTRFDFVPAREAGLGCEFRVPAESLMVLELRPGTLEGLRGVVRYQPEFSGF